MLALQQAAKKVKALHRSICIFPEGTRSLDGALLPLKSGGQTVLRPKMREFELLPFGCVASFVESESRCIVFVRLTLVVLYFPVDNLALTWLSGFYMVR